MTRSDAPLTADRALDRLRNAYARPLEAASEHQRRSGKVVGFVGQGAPVELVAAASAMPIQLVAELEHPTPRADAYMPDNHTWEARSLCEQLLSGTFNRLDAVVLTRPYGPLYHVLKEVHRTGLAPGLPDLFLFDLVQSDRAAFTAFNLRCIDDLAAFLERRLGAKLSDAAITSAIEAFNRRRILLRALQSQRRREQILGVDAMQVLGARSFLPFAEYETLLRLLVETERPTDAIRGRPKLIIYASEPLYHLQLHRALEGAGALVVAEDDFWGTRGTEVDAIDNVSPRRALLHRSTHANTAPHPIPQEQRLEFLDTQLNAGRIDGVVFYVPPSDHSFGWDYPRLRGAAESKGLRCLLLRDDLLLSKGRDAALGPLRQFIDELRSSSKEQA